jgi:hypothetical protein
MACAGAVFYRSFCFQNIALPSRPTLCEWLLWRRLSVLRLSVFPARLTSTKTIIMIFPFKISLLEMTAFPLARGEGPAVLGPSDLDLDRSALLLSPPTKFFPFLSIRPYIHTSEAVLTYFGLSFFFFWLFSPLVGSTSLGIRH